MTLYRFNDLLFINYTVVFDESLIPHSAYALVDPSFMIHRHAMSDIPKHSLPASSARIGIIILAFTGYVQF